MNIKVVNAVVNKNNRATRTCLERLGFNYGDKVNTEYDLYYRMVA